MDLNHPETAFTDPLEILLKEAISEGYNKTVKNAAPVPTKRVSTKFSKEENWKFTKAIALIHSPSNTLLGNFNEFIHNSLSARKLVRVNEPVATTGVEYVTGDYWLTEEREIAHSKRADNIREVTCGITLHEMQIHAPDARVRVHLLYDEDTLVGISKIELVSKTRFNCPTRNTFLFLEAGLDVIEAMDRDSKIALRAELGL